MRNLAWDWVAYVSSVAAVMGALLLAGGLDAPATIWRMVLMVVVAVVVILAVGRLQSRALKLAAEE